jgi:CHASE3 domain sensor protein
LQIIVCHAFYAQVKENAMLKEGIEKRKETLHEQRLALEQEVCTITTLLCGYILFNTGNLVHTQINHSTSYLQSSH